MKKMMDNWTTYLEKCIVCPEIFFCEIVKNFDRNMKY